MHQDHPHPHHQVLTVHLLLWNLETFGRCQILVYQLLVCKYFQYLNIMWTCWGFKKSACWDLVTMYWKSTQGIWLLFTLTCPAARLVCLHLFNSSSSSSSPLHRLKAYLSITSKCLSLSQWWIVGVQSWLTWRMWSLVTMTTTHSLDRLSAISAEGTQLTWTPGTVRVFILVTITEVNILYIWGVWRRSCVCASAW